VRRTVLFTSHELVRYENSNVRFVNLPPFLAKPPHLSQDGTFELFGCDPDKTYRLYVQKDPLGEGPPGAAVAPAGGKMPLPVPGGKMPGAKMPAPLMLSVIDLGLDRLLRGHKDPLGAVVDVTPAKAGGQPLTVKLGPCGSAEVRIVEDKGKPFKGILTLDLQVKPKQGALSGEWVALASGWQRVGQAPTLQPDGAGRLTIPGLIPGATYRLRGFRDDTRQVVVFEHEFTVEAGKTRKLPDIVVP
jgi:hypothetical protein